MRAKVVDLAMHALPRRTAGCSRAAAVGFLTPCDSSSYRINRCATEITPLTKTTCTNKLLCVRLLMLNLPEELMMGSSRVVALRVTVSFFARKAFILFSVYVSRCPSP